MEPWLEKHILRIHAQRGNNKNCYNPGGKIKLCMLRQTFINGCFATSNNLFNFFHKMFFQFNLIVSELLTDSYFNWMVGFGGTFLVEYRETEFVSLVTFMTE